VGIGALADATGLEAALLSCVAVGAAATVVSVLLPVARAVGAPTKEAHVDQHEVVRPQ
jgi:hypothetical protein